MSCFVMLCFSGLAFLVQKEWTDFSAINFFLFYGCFVRGTVFFLFVPVIDMPFDCGTL